MVGTTKNTEDLLLKLTAAGFIAPTALIVASLSV